MRLPMCLVTASVLGLLAGCSSKPTAQSEATNDEKKQYPVAIVGVWEYLGNAEDMEKGQTFEFTPADQPAHADGKMKVALPNGQLISEGSYTIDGDQVKTRGANEKDKDPIVMRIKKLTQNDLVFDSNGAPREFKRKKKS